MNISSFPDILSFRRQSSNITYLRQRLDIAASEAVTGRRENIVEATRGGLGRIHRLNGAMRDIEQSTELNAISTFRLQSTGLTLKTMRQDIGGLSSKAILTAASGGPDGLISLAEEAEVKLKSVFAALNTPQGGRFIFSGDQTDKPPLSSAQTLLDDVKTILSADPDPVSALDAYFNSPGGGFESRIYTGGTADAPDISISKTQALPFDIRADTSAIKQSLQGLAMLAAAKDPAIYGSAPDASPVFAHVSSVLSQATDGVIKLEGRVGVIEQSLEKQSTLLASEKRILNSSIQDMIGRDQYDAAAELSLLEAQLEASYSISARLSNLSLVNFLR